MTNKEEDMKKLGTCLLALILMSFSCANADEKFFSVKKIESVSVDYLWRTYPDRETLVNREHRIVVWFHQTLMYKGQYDSNEKPVALVLVAPNNLVSKPIGYQVTSKKLGRVSAIKTTTPDEVERASGEDLKNLVFFLELSEENCSACEKGWLGFSLDGHGDYILNSSNFSLHN